MSPGHAAGGRLESGEAQAAVALGLALAGLGNLLGLVDPPRSPPRAWSSSGVILGAVSLTVAMCPASERWRLTQVGSRDASHKLASLGVSWHNLPSSLAQGAALGAVLGLPGAGLLILPEHMLPAVPDEERFGLVGAVLFSFGHLLLATAAGEELAFRGLLQHKLRQAFGPLTSILLGSLFFTLWHGVYNARTLRVAGVRGRRRVALASAVQFAAVYLGGLAFAGLRERSGSLAGPVLAHWLTDVLLHLRLFARLERGQPVTRAAA